MWSYSDLRYLRSDETFVQYPEHLSDNMMGHNQSCLVEELKSAPSLCRIEDVLIGIINFRALTLKMVSKEKNYLLHP